MSKEKNENAIGRLFLPHDAGSSVETWARTLRDCFVRPEPLSHRTRRAVTREPSFLVFVSHHESEPNPLAETETLLAKLRQELESLHVKAEPVVGGESLPRNSCRARVQVLTQYTTAPTEPSTLRDAGFVVMDDFYAVNQDFWTASGRVLARAARVRDPRQHDRPQGHSAEPPSRGAEGGGERIDQLDLPFVSPLRPRTSAL